MKLYFSNFIYFFSIPLTGGSATLYPSLKIKCGEVHSPVTTLNIGDKFINNHMATLIFGRLLNAEVSSVYLLGH